MGLGVISLWLIIVKNGYSDTSQRSVDYLTLKSTMVLSIFVVFQDIISFRKGFKAVMGRVKGLDSSTTQIKLITEGSSRLRCNHRQMDESTI